MKKITNSLIDQIKQMNGRLLGVGIKNPKVLDQIHENSKIISCDLLDELEKGTSGSSKGKKIKKINLNQIRKQYKKKQINFLIVDEKMIQDVKTFVKDSIYITNTKIIYILDDDSKIEKKYKRYKTKIEMLECLDGKLLMVDVTKAKNNKIKEFFYEILDYFLLLEEWITNLLIN